MSCSAGHRHGTDLALPWLRYRLTSAAPIRPLPWELPYVTVAAVKRRRKNIKTRVPTAVQWVKNLTAVAQITVEGQVQSLAQHSGLKDPVLLQLWLGFSPWPGNFHMPWVQPLKKKKVETKNPPPTQWGPSILILPVFNPVGAMRGASLSKKLKKEKKHPLPTLP